MVGGGRREHPAVTMGGYAAVAPHTVVSVGSGEGELSGRVTGGRRRVVAVAAVAVVAVCCAAAACAQVGGANRRGVVAAALEEEKLLLGGKVSTARFLAQGLKIGASKDRKVKFFNLDEDPSLGSQVSQWGYTGSTGPDEWGKIQGFGVCGTGEKQSPVNIESAAEKSTLSLPALRWDGYAAKPFVQQGMETRAFFDGHSICLSGSDPIEGMNGPHLSVYGFSRYLDSLPLDAVPKVNYTLKEIRFHTPAEHQIDGQQFPFEMQMVHECNSVTDPSCPTSKTMIVSALFKDAYVGWGEKSPQFITDLMDDLRLIEGVWSQYVASYAFDFGKIADELNMYANDFFLLKGSLTVPPCSEDVTWYVLKDQVPISAADLAYAKKVMGNNARPIQPLNARAIFDVN